MTEHEEINKVIEDGKRYELLLEDDKVKTIITDLKDLAQNLAVNYAFKGEDQRRNITEQMIMCSGFINYVEGMVNAGKMAEVQLEMINSGELDTYNVGV